MKKSTFLFLGILLGTITLSQHLFSRPAVVQDEDPPGIKEAKSEVNVFPNPTNGRFQMTFEYTEKNPIHAKVFDITGKQVKDISDDLVISETSVTANVDLESPSSGIYFIRIELGNRLLTKKIIIK